MTPFDIPTQAQREAFIGMLQSNAQTPRHAPTIMLHAKRRGGGMAYYPMNPFAQAFAKLLRRPHLEERDVAIIKEELHYNIEIIGEGI